jgi:hypothetical protein
MPRSRRSSTRMARLATDHFSSPSGSCRCAASVTAPAHNGAPFHGSRRWFRVRYHPGATEDVREAVADLLIDLVDLLVDIPDTTLASVHPSMQGLRAADFLQPGGCLSFDVAIDSALPLVALMERARTIEELFATREGVGSGSGTVRIEALSGGEK